MLKTSSEALRLTGVIVAITVIDMVMSFGLTLWDLVGVAALAWIGPAVSTGSLLLGVVSIFLVINGRLASARKVLFALVFMIIIELASSTILMVRGLAAYASGPGGYSLLLDGALLWILNGLTFGLTYWLLDGDLWSSREKARRDFFFPQQIQNLPGYNNWHPDLSAYLFLAHCLNTAFSPTDTVIASKRAKALIVFQSAIGLTLFTVTIARSVNILQ